MTLADQLLQEAGVEQAMQRLPRLMEKMETVWSVPRAAMPGIKSSLVPAFVQWLRRRGIKITSEKLAPSALRPTQSEVDPKKVRKILKQGGEKVILISSDNRVLDGHHHWLAAMLRSFIVPISVMRVDLPMDKLLQLAHKFPQVQYKEFGESKGVATARLSGP